MNYVGKRRLLKLADFLEKLPPQKFNLNNWCVKDYKLSNTNEWDSIIVIRGKCGSTACALGYCPVVFPKSGFKLSNDLHWTPEYCGLEGTAAAEQFFDLLESESVSLFMPESYREDHKGPKSVAKKIRALVKRYESQKC